MRAFLVGAALGALLLGLFLALAGTPDRAVPGPPSASPLSPSYVQRGDIHRLRGRRLLLPVEGIPAGDLRDSFADARGSRVHEAIDIFAPRGTPVRAVDDGVVERLLRGGRGGLSVRHLDPTGGYRYYYAHLDAYEPGLREGASVRRGDLLGYVGSTGNAPEDAPHLHFAIFKLGPASASWRSAPVNPFVIFAPRR
jgi:murein DD-endopeptidase MepM/ murein hydrolase activator NlpD